MDHVSICNFTHRVSPDVALIGSGQNVPDAGGTTQKLNPTLLIFTMSAEGNTLLDGPRRTGDGYYEYVTLDPEGNRVEITA